MAEPVSKNIQRSAELQSQAKVVGVEFIITDLDTALTFARLAQQAGDDTDKRERNRENARNGYAAVVHFMHRLRAADLPQAVREEVSTKLGQLRSALESLGVQCADPSEPRE